MYDKLKYFNDMLNDFRVKITYMSIYDLLCEMLERTGYYNFVKAMPAGERRKANVDMLKEKAATYESGSYKGLFNFIRYIEKMNKYEIDMGEASIISENDNAVRIMTIHKSKGLEFPIVFIANMQKKFNLMDSRMKSVIHSDMGIGMEYIDEDTRIKTKKYYAYSYKYKNTAGLYRRRNSSFLCCVYKSKRKINIYCRQD